MRHNRATSGQSQVGTLGSVFSAIVVGTDGSDTARVAVERAVALGRLCGAPVHVVAAAVVLGAGSALVAAAGLVPDARAADAAAAEAHTILDKALVGIDADGVEVETHARTGDPADALLAVAEESGADLVVVGSRGLSGARRLLGSVPNRVAHRAQCSVHIVHTC